MYEHFSITEQFKWGKQREALHFLIREVEGVILINEKGVLFFMHGKQQAKEKP